MSNQPRISQNSGAGCTQASAQGAQAPAQKIRPQKERKFFSFKCSTPIVDGLVNGGASQRHSAARKIGLAAPTLALTARELFVFLSNMPHGPTSALKTTWVDLKGAAWNAANNPAVLGTAYATYAALSIRAEIASARRGKMDEMIRERTRTVKLSTENAPQVIGAKYEPTPMERAGAWGSAIASKAKMICMHAAAALFLLNTNFMETALTIKKMVGLNNPEQFFKFLGDVLDKNPAAAGVAFAGLLIGTLVGTVKKFLPVHEIKTVQFELSKVQGAGFSEDVYTGLLGAFRQNPGLNYVELYDGKGTKYVVGRPLTGPSESETRATDTPTRQANDAGSRENPVLTDLAVLRSDPKYAECYNEVMNAFMNGENPVIRFSQTFGVWYRVEMPPNLFKDDTD